MRGVIIALEDDIRIRRALAVAPNIDFYRYEVNFRLKGLTVRGAPGFAVEAKWTVDRTQSY